MDGENCKGIRKNYARELGKRGQRPLTSVFSFVSSAVSEPGKCSFYAAIASTQLLSHQICNQMALAITAKTAGRLHSQAI